MIRPLLLLAAFAALPAHAGGGETRSARVEIADLDLSTGAGQRELDRRVSRAVSRICNGDRLCRSEAWAGTWDQVNAAIARDRYLRACGEHGCRPPQPAYYAPPAPGATVVVVTVSYPPPPSVHHWPR